MSELWKSIPGYEGIYSASTQGRIRSEGRTVIRRNGAPQFWASRILSAGRKPGGHMSVRLADVTGSAKSLTVHRLILLTFVGPCPDGLEVLHADDNPYNNRLENLRYGTRSENQHDAVRNGKHAQAAKTSCIHGHPYTTENTGVDHRRGWRYCLSCKRDREGRRRAAAGNGIRNKPITIEGASA